ncbi:alpha/beta hydrolase [Acidiferrimicrobium sp. IK]|uniref:alpha/beta fold hydrolase n=1 Tax=Acidiferrimicrobium sp. IK TaxID=2871700 RepID=UPI0021CB5431|nr:alpha/beta hydrolase [Acidiferrimicrobium sp. IK]MCU4183394.1 alpha/beta hydrolase [Acidiferrimicrobium sp. IK]
MQPQRSGYVPVDGVEVYWERYGEGATPLVLVHPGFGLISGWGPALAALAERRPVVAIELQGHGHTADVDRPFSFDGFADQIVGVIAALGPGPVDLLGYSLGGLASLACALRYGDLLRRLVLVSVPCRRDGWFPEVLDGMERVGAAGFDQMRHSPMYAAWRAVTPNPDGFPTLMDKTGELLRGPYDWTEQIPGLGMATMLVYADADSIPPAHAAEFYGLLGGGLRDAGWDGSARSPHRLAVIPGTTHYDLCQAPEWAGMVDGFLAGRAG